MTALKILTKANIQTLSVLNDARVRLEIVPRTNARNIGHIFHGPRQRTHHTDDKADCGKNHGTGAVLGDCIHHDTECQDVTSHDEN
jgi:hypothetical protein